MVEKIIIRKIQKREKFNNLDLLGNDRALNCIKPLKSKNE